jgi:tRNA A37 methylthiotransferase MiaB
MPDQVPGGVIARRAQELRTLGEEKKRVFRAAQAGRTLRVLTLNREGEDAAGPWTRALSGNYVDVRVAGRWPANQMLGVLVHSNVSGILRGRPLPPPA